MSETTERPVLVTMTPEQQERARSEGRMKYEMPRPWYRRWWKYFLLGLRIP